MSWLKPTYCIIIDFTTLLYLLNDSLIKAHDNLFITAVKGGGQCNRGRNIPALKVQKGMLMGIIIEAKYQV